MEERLSRIPFSRSDEQTISSMARWMRFMAVVGIVGSIMLILFLVLGIGLYSAAKGLGDTSPKWAEMKKFLDDAGWLIYFAFAIFVLAAGVALWQNLSLYHAGDYFNLVARTDTKDMDYLAAGLDKLRTFFKIQVLIVIVTVAVAFGTALVTVAAMRHVH